MTKREKAREKKKQEILELASELEKENIKRYNKDPFNVGGIKNIGGIEAYRDLYGQPLDDIYVYYKGGQASIGYLERIGVDWVGLKIVETEDIRRIRNKGFKYFILLINPQLL